MQTMQTEELTEHALDWAVGTADSRRVVAMIGGICGINGSPYSPTTKSYLYEEIIAKGKIRVFPDAAEPWKAIITPNKDNPHFFFRSYGPTREIAALRCHVLSILGATVAVPKSLLSASVTAANPGSRANTGVFGDSPTAVSIIMDPKLIIIKDVWGSRNRSSEIVVKSESDTISFPYDDSSERRDQLENARDHANRLVTKALLSDIRLCIVDDSDLPQVPAVPVKTTPIAQLPDLGMSTVKTTDLSGSGLNFAVAKVLGHKLFRMHDHMRTRAKEFGTSPDRLEQILSHQPDVWAWLDSLGRTQPIEPYCDGWIHGGHIIDRERLEFRQGNNGMYASYPGKPTVWGKDYLEAGLRCIVVSKFGAEIDIPNELQVKAADVIPKILVPEAISASKAPHRKP